MDTVHAPPATRRWDPSRYAAIGYALCHLAAIVWAGSQVNVYSTDPDEFAAHFAESGSTTAPAWAAYLLLPLAALFLAWTVARLRAGLERPTGRGPRLGTVAVVGGTVLATALVVAGLVSYTGAVVAAGGGEADFPADPPTGWALMLAAGNLFVVQGLGAAVLVWAVALGARRTGQIPAWLAWVGFVLVPLLPFAWILFTLPWLVFLIWLVVVSLMLKTEPQPAAG